MSIRYAEKCTQSDSTLVFVENLEDRNQCQEFFIRYKKCAKVREITQSSNQSLTQFVGTESASTRRASCKIPIADIDSQNFQESDHQCRWNGTDTVFCIRFDVTQLQHVFRLFLHSLCNLLYRIHRQTFARDPRRLTNELRYMLSQCIESTRNLVKFCFRRCFCSGGMITRSFPSNWSTTCCIVSISFSRLSIFTFRFSSEISEWMLANNASASRDFFSIAAQSPSIFLISSSVSRRCSSEGSWIPIWLT